MMRGIAEPLSDYLGGDAMAAIAHLAASLRFDALTASGLWEGVVAIATTGELTPKQCSWDVEVQGIRIEVKSSSEFICRFRTGPRPVFKFALPKGGGAGKRADVVVLIGPDADQNLHTWVIPAVRVRKCASITITSPRVRIGAGRGFDNYYCPPSQLLPEILRAARLKDETP